MSSLCLHGYARGRVQGVSYRAFARSQAIAHAVHGYARNLVDGRVELLLCGEESAIQSVVAALRKGPPLAHVDAVELTATTWRDCDGFRIE